MAIAEISFRKGLNSKLDYLTDAPGQCLTFADWQLEYGQLKNRSPFNVVNQSVFTSSNTLVGGVTLWADPSQATINSISGYLYVVAGSKVFRSDATYSPSSDGSVTFSDITNSVTQPSGPVSFASLNGILVYCGNSLVVDQVTSKTANSSALTTVSGGLGMVRTVGNIMFGAKGGFGASSANSTIYWSAVGDPTTWPAGSNLTFRNNDGDCIQGIGELNGNVLIFKSNSIGLLNTQSIITSGTVTLGPLTTLFQGVGAAGPRAIDNLPDGRCVFLGTDFNVYITDGATLQCLTNNGPDGPNLLDALSANAPFQSQNTHLVYFPLRNEILVICQGTFSSTNFCYAYDLSQNYWRQITGITPYSVCVVRNPNNSSATPKATSAVLVGNNKGNVIDLARDFSGVVTDESGATVTTTVSASVVLPPNFINAGMFWLSIVLTGSVVMNYGFDGSYTGSANILNGPRYNVPIAIKPGTNNIRPTSFQIKFSTGSSGLDPIIRKVYLSDEALT